MGPLKIARGHFWRNPTRFFVMLVCRFSLSSAVEEIGNEVQIFAGKEIKEERKENCQYQAFFTLLVCVEML